MCTRNPGRPSGKRMVAKDTFSAHMLEPKTIPLDRLSQGLVAGHRRHHQRKSGLPGRHADSDFARYKGKLKGAIVLVSELREHSTEFQAVR